MKNHRVNYFILLFVVFGGFLIFGLSENIKGPALPSMQSEFSLKESQLGVLLALNSIGYLLACSFTSILANKIGMKWVGILAFASMVLAGFCMFLSKGYPSLSASYFLLYVGNGILEIGLGIMAARIFTKNTGTMMNVAHFFYGLSSIGAPILGASMMGWHVLGGELGWRGMYFIILSLSIIPIIPSLFGRFPEELQSEGESTSFRGLFRDPIAWLIVAVLSFGVVSEMAIGSWLVYYLQHAYEWSLKRSSEMLSLFFLLFTLSRLFVGPITDKLGYTLSIMLFSAFSGACSLAAVFIGETGAALFAIAGIGIAPIYPTVMALLAKRYAKGVGTAITFTVTILGIASVIGNLLIGVIIDFINHFFGKGHGNDLIGLQVGYVFIAGMAILCSLCCVPLYKMLRTRDGGLV
ncbi:major facilitator superfamily protein [Neobacillus bataviensis LMG 21833]|uniref:Major facilitator superfamily protein n=1 Tax=Neobacillus bataviensis LMG 21833 TaxID=1117379 RepID=K6D9A4_9BACI|nr:major facilitator superfamily protein [Neobacillus bataviensis LMG 21833]